MSDVTLYCREIHSHGHHLDEGADIINDSYKTLVLTTFFLSFTIFFAFVVPTTDAMYVFTPEELQKLGINGPSDYVWNTDIHFITWVSSRVSWNESFGPEPPGLKDTILGNGAGNSDSGAGNSDSGAGNSDSGAGNGYQNINAPSIININPLNKSVNVPVTKTIKVTFKENIKKGTNWIELKNSAGKAVAFNTSISGKILTIKPKNKLAESKYKLAIHTGAVKDLAGNPIALKSTSFTAGTPPIIKGTDPKNGATKVASSKTIKVTFSENIKAGSYNIELVPQTGKTVNIQKSIKNNILTITHKDKLKPKTKYALRLHTGSVSDKAGNPLKAKTIYFTTNNI